MESESLLLEGSFMNFIVGISNEIKEQVKVVLLEVSLIFGYPTRSNGRRKWFYSNYHW